MGENNLKIKKKTKFKKKFNKIFKLKDERDITASTTHLTNEVRGCGEMRMFKVGVL